MRNIVLGYGSLQGAASATATSTAAGYQPANPTTLARGTTWKAGASGDQSLVYEFGSAITPTFLGVANANWSKFGAGARLRHSNDGVSWTNYYTLASLPSTDFLEDFFAILTAAPARPWWSLQFPASSAAVEIGIFYLGYQLTLAKNPSYGAIEEDVYNVELDRSEGRVVVADRAARRLSRFEMAWERGKVTDRDEVRTILRGEDGPRRPFWFVPIDESGSSTAGRGYIGRMVPLSFPVRRKFFDRYEYGLNFLEEV